MALKPTNALTLVGSISEEEIEAIEDLIENSEQAGTPMALYIQSMLMDFRATVNIRPLRKM